LIRFRSVTNGTSLCWMWKMVFRWSALTLINLRKTPTYLNSQYSETGITDDAITIEPEVFTPDNDGEKDFTQIIYQFSEAGYSATIRIYDAKGREIKTLVRSELLGSTGQFQWDGTDDDLNKARTGIYIAHIEIFNFQGKVKCFKKQLVLGAKLN
jgi:flagellar hook assembly protein FlgD